MRRGRYNKLCVGDRIEFTNRSGHVGVEVSTYDRTVTLKDALDEPAVRELQRFLASWLQDMEGT